MTASAWEEDPHGEHSLRIEQQGSEVVVLDSARRGALSRGTIQPDRGRAFGSFLLAALGPDADVVEYIALFDSGQDRIEVEIGRTDDGPPYLLLFPHVDHGSYVVTGIEVGPDAVELDVLRGEAERLLAALSPRRHLSRTRPEPRLGHRRASTSVVPWPQNSRSRDQSSATERPPARLSRLLPVDGRTQAGRVVRHRAAVESAAVGLDPSRVAQTPGVHGTTLATLGLRRGAGDGTVGRRRPGDRALAGPAGRDHRPTDHRAARRRCTHSGSRRCRRPDRPCGARRAVRRGSAGSGLESCSTSYMSTPGTPGTSTSRVSWPTARSARRPARRTSPPDPRNRCPGRPDDARHAVHPGPMIRDMLSIPAR